MRVLAVTTWLPTKSQPSTGAFVVKDALALASLGHEVALIHLAPPEQLADLDAHEKGRPGTYGETTTIEGIPVLRIPMKTTDVFSVLRASKQLQKLAAKADVVHSMAFSSLLAMASWRPKVSWIHTEHWSGITAPQTLPDIWQAALPGLMQLLKRPDVVTAVCGYLAEPIREVRGTAPTLVIPCIVPAPFPSPRRTPAKISEELRLVSVGGLIARKDPVLAVDVVAELISRGQTTSIRFVGDGDLAPEIIARAAVLEISDKVSLVGTKDREGVLREYADADLFLGPTRGDNFFVSCAEAILSGRPVVVGSTGGQGEYIDSHVGRTVSQQDAASYADAIEQVLSTATNLSAGQISDTIGDEFAAATVADSYDQAYVVAEQMRGHLR
ncbi:glycosyltransferase family 4 protein [Ornithinimicrobium sp. Arc0846-15]|nr:glycosyltransferase family 4 protein [Ornithinimicrobium laminariae]